MEVHLCAQVVDETAGRNEGDGFLFMVFPLQMRDVNGIEGLQFIYFSIIVDGLFFPLFFKFPCWSFSAPVPHEITLENSISLECVPPTPVTD